MSTLHVFHNGTDWYIAESVADASECASEHYGCDPGDVGATPDELEQLADDANLSILDTEDPSGPKTMKKCSEWAASEGRGFLCSTEF